MTACDLSEVVIGAKPDCNNRKQQVSLMETLQ